MKRILVSLIGILLFWEGQRAFADTCATNLMPAFTANQATAICTKFGDSIAESLIPQADNSIDLGSASKTWRTLYTGTSRIAKTSDILRVRQDPQRLFTWDASSDTAFTATFGDGGTTATQNLVISGSTADADDDSTLSLAGGGASPVDGTRGAEIILKGNETASAGDLLLYGGSASTSDVAIRTTASDGIIRLQTNSLGRWTVEANGALTGDATNGGDLVFAGSGDTVSVSEATPGTACKGIATPNGVTNVTVNTTCNSGTAPKIFYSRLGAITNMGTISTTGGVANTSFTFASTGAADTLAGSVVWWIVK